MSIEIKVKDNKEFKCICCSKKIEHIDTGFDDSDVTQSCYNLSNVVRLNAGYGSRYDGDVIYFGICDKCLDEKKDNLVYAGDYMQGTNLQSDNYEEHEKYFKDDHLLEEDK